LLAWEKSQASFLLTGILIYGMKLHSSPRPLFFLTGPLMHERDYTDRGCTFSPLKYLVYSSDATQRSLGNTRCLDGREFYVFRPFKNSALFESFEVKALATGGDARGHGLSLYGGIQRAKNLAMVQRSEHGK
jgi:hypothetical protein